MTTPAIGAKTFTTMRGRITRTQLASKVVDRPGVPGVLVQFGEWHAQVDRLVTTAYAASEAAAGTLCEDYRTIVKNCRAGTTVSIQEAVGTAWTNCNVLAAVPVIDNVIEAGLGTWRVTCEWQVLIDQGAP